MKSQLLLCLMATLGGSCPLLPAAAKEAKPAGWAYASGESVAVEPSPSSRKRPIAHLDRGALAELYESVSKGGAGWSRVRVVNLETLEPLVGWVDSSQIASLPLEQFPADADLLQQLGGPYLDDTVKSQVRVARFLVPQSGAEPALVCWLGSTMLPQARLQVFRPAQAGQAEKKFAPGPFLELPFSEMGAGITALEVRNLVGDGNACLVTREPFELASEQRGMNLVIRRIGRDGFEKLWEAPLEYRNLASFPAQYRVLKPPELNIGLPGTVTEATVEFRVRGHRSEPVWKGKVEFRVPGREAPVEGVAIEKLCRWEGAKFRALK